jgi:hypothetical protein
MSFDLSLFTKEDRSFLKTRVDEESGKIFSNKRPNDKRTLNQIWLANAYGQAAETFLIRYCGFTDNPAPYQDVLFNDTPVEVKVTKGAYYLSHVLERMNAKKRWKASNPDWVFVYTMDRATPGTNYEFLGSYFWNGNSYTQTDWNLS